MTFPDYSRVDELTRQHIEGYGWSVVGVGAGPDSVQFSYTVGLTLLDLPEFVIAGLPIRTGQQLLNTVAALAKDGARFAAGDRVADIITGYRMAVVELPQLDAPPENLWPGVAYRTFGAARVRLQQFVWPDAERRFPWDDGYDFPAEAQPLLTSGGGS